MPARNRVTPFGQIVAMDQRGTLMGNRGSIHRGWDDIARPWQVRRWITCVLSYKDWVAPKWEPGRWTPLFFWDEAVALAAGHRPCALCRRADYNRWCDAWEAAFDERPGADAMDLRLHTDRLEGRAQRLHPRRWSEVPPGSYVLVDDVPALVLDSSLRPWSPAGYGPATERPAGGNAAVLTPAATLEVLRHGYRPVIHPSIRSA